MEEISGISFRPTAAQRRFFEGHRLMAGQRSGRRLATEAFIVATAANPAEAKLALEDLFAHGIAALSAEGKRIEPGRGGRRFAAVKFDEEKA